MRWRTSARWKDESGFTLLELVSVIVTIAILIAISIPTFKAVFQAARDRAAQSNLRNAYKVAKLAYYDNESFDTGTPAALTPEEPALTFSTGGPQIAGNTKTIFISTANGPNWLAVGYSASGTYFGLAVTAGEGVGRCKTTTLSTAQSWSVATCTATTW